MSTKSTRAILTAATLGMIALPGGASADRTGGVEVFLDSAIAVDVFDQVVTLPLFSIPDCSDPARSLFYVVFESSDRDDAEIRGVNFSPKLANALGTSAVQPVDTGPTGACLHGTVDFTPEHIVVPGPTDFPPAAAAPGSTGNAAYSPLVTFEGRIVLNAPQVANETGLHDKVISIDFLAGRVTLRMTQGIYHGKDILYVSTDASDPGAAAVEEATFAPNLNAAPGIATRDPRVSARSAIIPIVNGATGVDNPERQGLSSAILGEGDPLNITEIHPRNRGEIVMYSPLWDVHPAVWTDEAIAGGYRVRLNHHEDVIDAIEDGLIVSGGAGPENPDLAGLRAAGFVVNCPVVTLQ